jgi:serine/threonine protein kinase
MAPEVIKSTKYDNKCDIYSFGIIMFQILTQCDDKQIYTEYKLKDTIDFILSTDPNFRPEIQESYLIYIINNFFIQFLPY